jgi:MFS family permease
LNCRKGLLISLVGLVPTVALLIAAEAARSMSILLISTAIAGVSTGLGYRCGLQMVNEIAPEERRAEVVSTYLIACYAGISIPIVGIGILSQAIDPLVADSIFAGVIVIISLLAFFIGIAIAKSK